MQFLIFAQQTQRINIGKGELIGGSDKFILQFFKQVLIFRLLVETDFLIVDLTVEEGGEIVATLDKGLTLLTARCADINNFDCRIVKEEPGRKIVKFVNYNKYRIETVAVFLGNLSVRSGYSFSVIGAGKTCCSRLNALTSSIGLCCGPVI